MQIIMSATFHYHGLGKLNVIIHVCLN